MTNIVALIPARSGSKGVLNKNIRPIGGIPLIAYSIAAALKSTLIDRVVVSTDSEKYAELARSFGAETPFIRPVNISGDSATDIEFFKHAISWFKDNENCTPRYLVHLRPTTPFRDPKIIDKLLKSLYVATILHLGRAIKCQSHHIRHLRLKIKYLNEYVMGGVILKVRMLQGNHFRKLMMLMAILILFVLKLLVSVI